jgi:hypothetical protein
VFVAFVAVWQLAVGAVAITLAGYSALRTGQRAIALGLVGSALTLLTWIVVEALAPFVAIPARVVPLAVAGPTLLAALISAWWRSSRLLKVMLPPALAGLVLLLAGRTVAALGWSYVAVGTFVVCGYARVVAGHFAASLVAVFFGFVFGGVMGLLPAIIVLAVFITRLPSYEVEVLATCAAFFTAGGLLGAVGAAARRRGARTDFGTYTSPGFGPAVEVLAFKGPPLRFSAEQLRAMADLLDRHGQSFQLRPLVGPPSPKKRLPPVDPGHPTLDADHRSTDTQLEPP